MIPACERISGTFQNDIRSRLKKYLCIIVAASVCSYLVATSGSNKNKYVHGGVRRAETALGLTAEKKQLRITKAIDYNEQDSPDDDETSSGQDGEDIGDDEASSLDDDYPDDDTNDDEDDEDDLASYDDADDESSGIDAPNSAKVNKVSDVEIVEEVKDAVEDADEEIEVAEEDAVYAELDKLQDPQDDVESTMEQVVEDVLAKKSTPVAEIASVEIEVAERLEDEIEDNLKIAANKILKEQEDKMKEMAIGDTKDSMANVDI
eukprot:CAMPEP_0172479510 /NCGR_PEP_ID=MMETSP1066-20121228/4160_1 /TAXON_ID=671091 /ORGANISM="Coscinodiscus wailesii, Strain CCMP2513" /LENGTH=262 /DNA_ID=CAMNT_0013240061 /DNA_START=109 /DNA_END=894 /DNA_ORIENTATION=-